MLERLPFYGQLLVFVVISLGLVLAAYAVWPNLGQMRTQVEELEKQFTAKQAEIRKGQAAEQRLPELEREIAAKKQELSDLEQILPSDRETGDLLRYVKNLGDQSNLSLKFFEPKGLKPGEYYKEFPIEMQVAGRYHDLGMFLDRVSKYSRIINVDNLRIGTLKQAGSTIQAGLTATTFVYTESSTEEGTR
jgi:type IV pilus assembly protein PilO